jgi:hypothetical protein
LNDEDKMVSVASENCGCFDGDNPTFLFNLFNFEDGRSEGLPNLLQLNMEFIQK